MSLEDQYRRASLKLAEFQTKHNQAHDAASKIAKEDAAKEVRELERQGAREGRILDCEKTVDKRTGTVTIGKVTVEETRSKKEAQRDYIRDIEQKTGDAIVELADHAGGEKKPTTVPDWHRRRLGIK